MVEGGHHNSNSHCNFYSGKNIVQCIYIDTMEIRALSCNERSGEDTGRMEIAGTYFEIAVPDQIGNGS